MSASATSVWNSLEIVKLIVGALTPIALLGVGFWINRILKRIEHLQWANQKMIERRLNVFDQLAPLLNDLLCYMTYIGTWQEHQPPEIIAFKRKTDKLVYVNASLFPPRFLEAYHGFIHSCFSTYTGWGNAAKIRSAVQRHREAAGEKWDESWNECFETTAGANVENVQDSYAVLMDTISSQLGIVMHEHRSTPGRIPS